MNKVNKKEDSIYTWLNERKGYLKKGIMAGFNIYRSTVDKTASFIDYNDALRRLRLENEGSYKPKSKPSKPVKITTYKPIRPSNSGNKQNTLAISDMHEPFCKEGYMEHCMEIAKKYECTRIVLIGDEVDLCGIGQWEKDPDGFSAGSEAAMAHEKMKLWYKAFPEAYVCIGNHTARPFRMARTSGIPKKFIKSYEEAWEAPSTWKWAENWEFDGVLYTHGTGFSGANAAIRIATRHRQNTVIGHIHSEAGIQYSASKIDLVWGMQLGGALDDSSYAAYYAKDQLKKSIVGCGVVLEGRLPIYEPMKL